METEGTIGVLIGRIADKPLGELTPAERKALAIYDAAKDVPGGKRRLEPPVEIDGKRYHDLPEMFEDVEYWLKEAGYRVL